MNLMPYAELIENIVEHSQSCNNLPVSSMDEFEKYLRECSLGFHLEGSSSHPEGSGLDSSTHSNSSASLLSISNGSCAALLENAVEHSQCPNDCPFSSMDEGFDDVLMNNLIMEEGFDVLSIDKELDNVECLPFESIPPGLFDYLENSTSEDSGLESSVPSNISDTSYSTDGSCPLSPSDSTSISSPDGPLSPMNTSSALKDYDLKYIGIQEHSTDPMLYDNESPMISGSTCKEDLMDYESSPVKFLETSNTRATLPEECNEPVTSPVETDIPEILPVSPPPEEEVLRYPEVRDLVGCTTCIGLDRGKIGEVVLEESTPLKLSRIHFIHSYSVPYIKNENSGMQLSPRSIEKLPTKIPLTTLMSVRRKPGRPPKNAGIPKVAQKKTLKKGKSSSPSSQRRQLHNLSERNRRNDLKSNMQKLSQFIPEELLQAAAKTISMEQKNRTEEVENSYAVNIMQKMDELIKNNTVFSPQRGKKTNSKMVVLLATTYFYSTIEKDLKSKETFIRNENSNYFRSRQSKRVKH